MHNAAPRTLLYSFGPFELDPVQGSLARNGTRVKLQDLPCRLLVMLVERPGEIVTREEVRHGLWPENTFVEFDNSLGVAIRKIRDSLGDNSEAPRYVETIPRRGYRFLPPVTAHESTGVTVSKPLADGGGDASDLTTGTPALASQTSSLPARYLVPAAIILLLLGGAIYGFRIAPRHQSTRNEERTPTVLVRVRRSVAVLGFRNLPGHPKDNWLSAAFSEMLSTELASGGQLRLVSGEDVARAKSELPLTDEDTLAKSTLKRLYSDPGADVVVLGSYTPMAGKGMNRIRLDIRLQDTAAGETIAEESVTGSEENLFELASETGNHLREALGVGSLSAQAAAMARASLPSNQQAVRLYTAGRIRSWSFDFRGARDLLLMAVAADPSYAMAHSSLSEAYEHLGYDAKARAEAQRASELSAHLPPEERLLIEGQYRETMQEWPRAVQTYQSLFSLFPDSLEYGLHLAAAQRRTNPSESMRTLAALRHLPFPSGEDPRIDMIEAAAWITQDLAKAHAAAERAIAKGNAQGSHLLVARAYGMLCEQGSSVGATTAEALGACENARQSYAAAGDRDNEARTLSDFAVLYSQQGDLARAETMWREAIPEFRELGDMDAVAAATNNLGDVFFLRGSLNEAKKFLQQAFREYQAVGDKDGVALLLNDLGDLARERGDLEAALTTYRQAKATAEEIDDKSAVAYVLNGVGDVLADRGDLAGARKSYEESLTLRTQAGEKQTAAETRMGLAKLSVEEGHAEDAESAMRECIDQFHEEKQSDDQLAASVILLQTLIAQNKQVDAQKEMEGDQSLGAKSQNSFLRLQFALVSGRVALASDHPGSSRRMLEQVLREARAHGFVAVELEADLALAQLAKKTEPAAASEERLISVEKKARAKGFGLIARKAAAGRT